MMNFRRLFSAVLFCFCGMVYAEVTENVVLVSGRPSVQVPYLLTQSASSAPKSVYVLLSGGYGEHNLSQRGTVVQVFNDLRLLARTRGMFAGNDGAAALIDVPADRSRLSDDFRISEAHAQDVGAVIADLRQRYPAARIVVVGHSNGTLSAAHVAARMGANVDRVVLISGRLVAHWYGGDALSKFDFGQIKAQLLLVHHLRDGCTVTPYAGSLALADRYPLISVNDAAGVEIGGCSSNGTHNLNGKEVPVVQAIRAWVNGAPWATEIQ